MLVLFVTIDPDDPKFNVRGSVPVEANAAGTDMLEVEFIVSVLLLRFNVPVNNSHPLEALELDKVKESCKVHAPPEPLNVNLLADNFPLPVIVFPVPVDINAKSADTAVLVLPANKLP